MRYYGFLALPMGLLVMALTILYAKPNTAVAALPSIATFVPLLALVFILALLIQFVVVRRGLDKYIFPVVFMLAMLGLAEIARLKPQLFSRQLMWLAIAMLLVLAIIRLWRYIRRALSYPYLLGLGCVVVLGLPLLFGTEIGGSRNWLVLGPMSIQPSEFGKLLILFFLTAYLVNHRQVLANPTRKLLCLRLPPLRFIAPLICIWGLAVLMFVVERDLGSALLFFGMAIMMTYMATGSKSYVAIAVLFIAIAAAASYAMFGHVRVRFDIWLDPWQDPNGMAYQVVQSLFAIASGGVWGTGFCFGHPGFIPEVHTDFIFAAIAEELGFIGVVVVVSLYSILFWRGIKIALSRDSEKEALLAAGAATLLLLQSFIIIAGVTKFLPLTGITLPFISYGGSSLITSFALLAILLVLSKEQRHGR